MKTTESEDSTADRVNQLVDIYKSQSVQEDKPPSFDEVLVQRERAQQTELQQSTESENEIQITEFRNEPITYTNKAFVSDEGTVHDSDAACTSTSSERVAPTNDRIANGTNILNPANLTDVCDEAIEVFSSSSTMGSNVTPISVHSSIHLRRQHTVVHDAEKAGAMQQFWVLFRRALANNLEDYSFLGVQAIEALAMSLMIGLVFYNLGLDQISIRDRFGLLYIICALYPYMVILDVVGQYHRERNILYFEMQDGLYTPAPYFFAKVLSEVPEHTVFIILYGTPVYFMAGLQEDPGHFFLMLGISFIVVYCSRSMAMFAASLMPTYQLSVLVAQALFTMFLLSCGFIFNLENIWVGVKWTSYISYLKWSYQAMCHVEFRNLNFECELPIPSSCILTGDEALKVYSLDGSGIWQCSLIVCAEITIFLALFFIGMKFISQKPHEQ